MNGNMVRPFHKRGRAWKAVVRWYWPVEPSDTRPRWCATFSLRYTRKKDRICYDTKLFETRSPREGFNILTGVFRPRATCHCTYFRYQSFYTIVPGITDRDTFRFQKILLQTHTCFPATLPRHVARSLFLPPWNKRATYVFLTCHTMRKRVQRKLKSLVRPAPIEQITCWYFAGESDTQFFSPPNSSHSLFESLTVTNIIEGAFIREFTKIEAREFRKMRVLTAN